jgi:hypothetical protein
MNNKNNITMTKFNLTKYYKQEEKLGSQGGGWAEPTMTNQQIAHKIYTKWQDKSDLKNWKQDEEYNTFDRVKQNTIHDIINNFIRQDYF